MVSFVSINCFVCFLLCLLFAAHVLRRVLTVLTAPSRRESTPASHSQIFFCRAERPEIVGSDGGVEHITVIEGENAELNCKTSAVPLPEMTWFKEDAAGKVAGKVVVRGKGK